LLGRVLKRVDRLSVWVGKCAGYLLYAIVAIMSYEVVARYAFDSPTEWAGELAQMVFGACFMLAGAIALVERAHVNMDVIYERLPPRSRALVDVVTAPLFFLFVGVLLWQGGTMWIDSLLAQQHSQTVWAPPLYPYKSMIPLGAALLILQGLAKFIRDLAKAVSGRTL
jgi:TRAP-type mannitol/chloroaromatic compound transport system permease small subunit